MPKRDFYDILGVTRSATPEELKRAHRRLVREWHPDRNKSPEAAARFNEVQEAYDTLSDPEKRSAYDRFGQSGVEGAGLGGEGRPRTRTYTWTGGGPGGFGVEGAGPDLGSVFEELFGRGRAGPRPGRAGPRSAATKGADLHHTLDIIFDTAARGGKEQVRLSMGDLVQTLDVTIPKGIADGAKLRLRGKGQPSPTGGAAGDLILTIRVGKHAHFRREGLDLYLDLPVTVAEAVLGATVSIPTLKGRVSLKVPPDTTSGRKMRITGHGIEASDGRTGDFYAVVQVQTPTDLNESDLEYFRSLSARLSNPRRRAPWEGVPKPHEGGLGST